MQSISSEVIKFCSFTGDLLSSLVGATGGTHLLQHVRYTCFQYVPVWLKTLATFLWVKSSNKNATNAGGC